MALCILSSAARVGTNPVGAWNGTKNDTSKQVIFNATSATFDSQGNASCASGSHLLLTPDEYNAIKPSILNATPEQYQAQLVLFGAFLTALALIWSAKRLLKLFNQASEA